MSSTVKASPVPITREKYGADSTRDELYTAGKALREKCPRTSHAEFKPAPNRPDAIELVLRSEKGRIKELLPLRHGRMVRSAFTFYRGAALTMAYDLSTAPATGLRVQCCGDAHLCNFGGFATPERRVIFSVNDLDETLPAPWEWDVKRLAASFLIACRNNRISDAAAKDVVMACVRSYRQSMAEYSQLKTLELWYSVLDLDELVVGIKDATFHKRAQRRLQKERARSVADDIFPKLAEQKGEKPVIKDQLPTIFHMEGYPPGQIQKAVRDAIMKYRATLHHAQQSLLDRYELYDAAIKVVGVGSVGTSCWVLLFMAGEGDPLFLQVKEANASVLEAYAGASVFSNHGERVVNGIRLMQPASDMFLGFTEGYKGRHFYIRQLRDIKVTAQVELFTASDMKAYATVCGRALALSHARSGLSVMLSGYMGKSDAFDRAIADFSVAYADQAEKDHAAFERAVRSGKVKAEFEEEA